MENQEETKETEEIEEVILTEQPRTEEVIKRITELRKKLNKIYFKNPLKRGN